MGAKIQRVAAKEEFALRGNVRLQVTVTTDDGSVGTSTPEVGVSTGKYEAEFVLDGGERYEGMGVLKAAENINRVIGPALADMDVTHQREIDSLMRELDGTPNKGQLGANAIVGVSLAVLKAAANSAGLPLYQYIGGPNACLLPIPIVGGGSAGRYRDPGKDRWFKPSFHFVGYGSGSYSAAMYDCWRANRELSRLAEKKYGHNVRQYSGISSVFTSGLNLAGVLKDDREYLDLMAEAIVRCGLEDRLGLYYDAAAGCYYEPEIDRYAGLFSEGEKTRDQLLKLYQQHVASYPLLSIEDPFHEEDFEGHALATRELGIEIVGDDLFTTNARRLQEGVAAGAANSMVLKVTQVGTVSEALEAAEACRLNGYNVHPCGSRGDLDSLGDFAVGLNAGQVRGCDQNRMLAIEEELGKAARWPGKALFKGSKNRPA